MTSIILLLSIVDLVERQFVRQNSVALLSVAGMTLQVE